MKTNRLSENVTEVLNKQLLLESHAAQIYLSYGVWADSEGYGGISNFLLRHADEERDHMTKVMQYIMLRGGKPIIPAIPAPPADPTSIYECFHKVLEHEVTNTNGVYDCVNAAHDEKDWATWNFMQWFVEEQVEEETFALDLIDKIEIAGGINAPKSALYMINQELMNESGEAPSAVDATAEYPV